MTELKYKVEGSKVGQQLKVNLNNKTRHDNARVNISRLYAPTQMEEFEEIYFIHGS